MLDIDGRPVAKHIRETARASAEALRERGVVPTLAIIAATSDEGAWWYVRTLEKTATTAGIDVRIKELPTDATTEIIAEAIRQQAEDPAVHGILLQTPLPHDVNIDDLLELIPPEKDVDGANPVSAGRLLYGTAAFAPATAEAVLVLLDHYKIPLDGKRITVIGRSRIVGKPVAHLLLARDATVTVCHSRTVDIKAHMQDAEVLLAAVGKPKLITKDMVLPGAYVIDVGTNVVDDQLVGDVDPAVAEVAAGLTPVPGGVGPVTTALILQHTIAAVRE